MINDRKIRICLIGAGRMANSVHYPSLASFNDVKIVGVIETRADRLKLVCDEHGIPDAARFLVDLDTDYRRIVKDLARTASTSSGSRRSCTRSGTGASTTV